MTETELRENTLKDRSRIFFVVVVWVFFFLVFEGLKGRNLLGFKPKNEKN